jgi:hypothetical protein
MFASFKQRVQASDGAITNFENALRGDQPAGSAVRRSKLWRSIGNGGPVAKTINESGGISGGEAGIRILRATISNWLMARHFWL